MKPAIFLFAVGMVAAGAGCSSVNHDTVVKSGYAEREVLVDRLNETCRSQAEAKEQFASALERFLAVKGGELMKKYDELNTEFQRCEKTAEEVRNRIAAVENVANELFVEWNRELPRYSNPSSRQQSQEQLEATRRRYDDLIKLMRRAADRMDPVLATFRDQMLFLKQNLNATAIASLDSTTRTLEAGISRLIVDMEISVRESDIFVKSLKSDGESYAGSLAKTD